MRSVNKLNFYLFSIIKVRLGGCFGTWWPDIPTEGFIVMSIASPADAEKEKSKKRMQSEIEGLQSSWKF